MIKIVFGKSSSHNYNLAIKHALKNASNYYETNSDDMTINVAEYELDNIVNAEKLWDMVRKWKSAEIYINDTSPEEGDLILLREIVACMKRHDESLLPEEYCIHGNSSNDLGEYFGCKKLTRILKNYKWENANFYYHEAPNIWYRLNKIDRINNILIVDKARMKKLLAAQAEKELLKFCPYYSEDTSFKMIEELPSEIELSGNSGYLLDDSDKMFIVVRSSEEVLRKKELDEEKIISFNKGDEYKDDSLEPEFTNISYRDIGGLDKEIRLIRESIEIPLKYPELFDHLGITAYKGILFYGPPGTGKTQLAKAVANESEMKFFTINGPEIFNKYFGESEKKLREIFESAKKNTPSVIFIDEIDSIASKRGDSSTEVFYNKIVTQLLTLMDGIEEHDKVVVMAATNRPDSLDPAIRRPGRFDFEIYISPPDERGRIEILKIHTRKMPLEEDVDLVQIAKLLYGYVGADILALCREAALFALRRNVIDIDTEIKNMDSIKVIMDDFKQAKNKIIPTAGREVLSYKPNVKWIDVIGLDEIKREIEKKIIKPWIMKNKYSGFRRIKGLLLYGPSGVGKTYMSKALASELEMNIISLKGSDVLSKYHGGSSSKIRNFFDKARELSPCMILIDEIDAIAPSRESNTVTADLVNELLSQMDGYDELTDVLVVATTNLINLIDEAILRPGRFDLKIELKNPMKEDLNQLFKYYLDKSPLSYDEKLLDFEFEGVNGADIENLVNQALYEAIWNGDTILTKKHLELYRK